MHPYGLHRYGLPPIAVAVRLLRGAGLAALMTVIATDAAAQSIDYPALEQIFGEPVTKSATGKPQRASDAPVNMEIITQSDIRRSGAVTIPDVLQFVTGIDVRHYGIAAAEVGMRGSNQPYNPRLLVLVNGRQVYSDDYGHVAWPTIPVQLEEIRQIEVIKGPNSALYGFNAVSGVINIITYDPLRDSINTATLRAGTQGYAAGSVVGTAQIGDKAGLRISVGGFRARDYTPGALLPADAGIRQSPRIGAFNVGSRARVAPGVEVFAEASASDSRFAEKDFSGAFDTTFTRANSLRAGISADTPFGLLSLSAYRNGQRISLDIPGLSGSLDERVYVVQASDLIKFGSAHTVRFGIEFRDNSATSASFAQGTIGYTAYAANLMWDWRMTPDLSWTNAARIDTLQLHYNGMLIAGSGVTQADYNRASVTAPSFNSGLVYTLTPKDTLRLMVARGVQLPSLVDFGLQIPALPTTGALATGNPGLHPSTTDSIELNYDRSLPALMSSLRLAVFAQRSRDLIGSPYSVAPILGPAGVAVLKAANVGSSTAAGIEIGIKGHSQSGLRWQASYALSLTTDDTTLNRGSFVTSTADYARSVPRHVVLGGLGYTSGKLELDLLARWQSSYRDFQTTIAGTSLQPVEVRNYLLLNARIGYQLTNNVTLAVTAQQFNASRMLQTAGPQVERRAIASVTAHF